jgi:F0F1-type ATP synthase assembly protein I
VTKRLGNSIYTRPRGEYRKTDPDNWKKLLGRYLDYSYKNIVTIGVFGMLGWWLDRKFDTEPYLLISGIFLGAALGISSMIYTLSHLHNNPDE